MKLLSLILLLSILGVVGICITLFSLVFKFTLILLLTGSLGINDEFCYVNKFEFKIINETVNYNAYLYFQSVVIVVYFVRVVNFVGTVIFLKKIISYISLY